MRSLAGSLADGLAEAILILPRPPVPTHQYKEDKGSSKEVWKLKEKRRCWDG